MRKNLLAKLSGSAIAEQDARKHGAQNPEDRIACRSALPLSGMLRSDMASLMAQHSSKFCLVVHQSDELAGDIDIAARNCESVVDRRIEQGDGEIAAGVGQTRLHRDVLADTFNIACLRTSHRAAEFGNQLRMGLGPFRLVSRADRLNRRRLDSFCGNPALRRESQAGG